MHTSQNPAATGSNLSPLNQPSLRVTHIVRQYLPSIGGMEEVVRNIARHQLRQGQRRPESSP